MATASAGYVLTVASGQGNPTIVPDYATYLQTYVDGATNVEVQHVGSLSDKLGFVQNASDTYQALYPGVPADPATLTAALNTVSNFYSQPGGAAPPPPPTPPPAPPIIQQPHIASPFALSSIASPLDLGTGDYGGACDPSNPYFDPVVCAGGNGGGVSIDLTMIGGLFQHILTSINNVGSAISDGLSAQETAIANVPTLTAQAIQSGLDAAVGAITDFTNGAFGSIGDTISNIFGGIKDVLVNIGTTIYNGIVGAIGALGTLLNDIFGGIKDKISELIQAIKDNGASAIIPVIQLIVTEMVNIENIIAAIRTDLHAGMAALVLLPVQIASSLGSLDATLNRALQQLGVATMPRVTTDVTLGGVPFSPSFASSLEQSLTPNLGLDSFATLASNIISLREACEFGHIGSVYEKFQAYFNSWPQWLQVIASIPFATIEWILVTGDVLIKQLKLAEEQANLACPIEKLQPRDAVTANIRGILMDADYKQELKLQGYDDTRATVLRQIASANLDVGVALDSWNRGTISDLDLHKALSDVGYSDSQIAILKAHSVAVPTVDDVLRWFRLGAVNEATARGVLSQLSISTAQQDLIFQTFRTPPATAQHIAVSGRLDALQANYPSRLLGADIPQPILDAALIEGITADNAQLMWQQHWEFPSYLVIIQSMFRLFRTENEVRSAMTAENIPSEFHDELIKLQRPLIPFRSIPSFLKAGVMRPDQAVIELNAHGFDPLHIGWIMDYATKSAKTPATGAQATIQSLSLQAARTLFDDGAISRDQYISVLEAHKYTPDLAAAQADAEDLSNHTKERKQLIADLVDEVAGNFITLDDALTQLHQFGATQVEIARFSKAARTALRSAAKHPSISDLKLFLKAQIMTLDQYRTELAAQGWTDPWLSNFVALETPTSSP